jgi:hypothetical protein
MDEVRGDDASTELAYSLRGVGGDSSCPLQVVADEAVTTPEGIGHIMYILYCNGVVVCEVLL